MKKMHLWMVVLTAALGLTACDEKKQDVEEAFTKDAMPKAERPVPDVQNYARFNIEFSKNFDELSDIASASVTGPWPSNPWRWSEDGINSRSMEVGDICPTCSGMYATVSDVLSPAEKYDKAFSDWRPSSELPIDFALDCDTRTGVLTNHRDAYYSKLGSVADWEHRNRGLYFLRNGYDDNKNTDIDECTGEMDGLNKVGDVRDFSVGWTAAALSVPEPYGSVTTNAGVVFSGSDIKALLSAHYSNAAAIHLSGNCHGLEVSRESTSFTNVLSHCSGATPGDFHLALVNMLGIAERPFAVEFEAADVRALPVYGYRIVHLEEVDRSALSQSLTVGSKFYRVTTDVDFVAPAAKDARGALAEKLENYTRTVRYNYFLVLDENGNIRSGVEDTANGYGIWKSPDGKTVLMNPATMWVPVGISETNPRLSQLIVPRLAQLSAQGDRGEKFALVSNQNSVPVPDANPKGQNVLMSLSEKTSLTHLSALLDLEHSYVGDLTYSLTQADASKADSSVILRDQIGGSGCVMRLEDDDEPVRNCNSEYRLSYDLSPYFAKGTKNGKWSWTLHLEDKEKDNSGTLYGLSILSGMPISGYPTATTLKRTTYTRAKNELLPDAVSVEGKSQPGVLNSVLDVFRDHRVRHLEVYVELEHEHPEDLVIRLEHKSQSEILHYRENVKSFVREDAANDAKAVSMPNGKLFRSDSWAGTQARGPWTLHIEDHDEEADGVLKSWSLSFVE